MMFLAIDIIPLAPRPIGKGSPFVAGNRSFYAAYFNDELVRAFEANKGGGAAVQILR
jgi:hypothetical protein